MKSIHSALVAFDGEAKCGKTTIIESVAKEARYQEDVVSGVLDKPTWLW